jgi:hypothetical protein
MKGYLAAAAIALFRLAGALAARVPLRFGIAILEAIEPNLLTL